MLIKILGGIADGEALAPRDPRPQNVSTTLIKIVRQYNKRRGPSQVQSYLVCIFIKNVNRHKTFVNLQCLTFDKTLGK